MGWSLIHFVATHFSPLITGQLPWRDVCNNKIKTPRKIQNKNRFWFSENTNLINCTVWEQIVEENGVSSPRFYSQTNTLPIIIASIHVSLILLHQKIQSLLQPRETEPNQTGRKKERNDGLPRMGTLFLLLLQHSISTTRKTRAAFDESQVLELQTDFKTPRTHQNCLPFGFF